MRDIVAKPVACVCTSSMDMHGLVKRAASLPKREELILLLKDDETLIYKLLPAYLNAVVRKRESVMRAKNLTTEMMLLVAGTMQISKAMECCAAKDSKRFIVFASGSALLKKFTGTGVMVAKKLPLDFDGDVAEKIAVGSISD